VEDSKHPQLRELQQQRAARKAAGVAKDVSAVTTVKKGDGDAAGEARTDATSSTKQMRRQGGLFQQVPRTVCWV